MKEKDIDYYNHRYDELLQELMEVKQKQSELGGPAEEPKQNEEQSQCSARNIIIMMETAKTQNLSVPENYETLPPSMKKIVMREQTRLQESFCQTLRSYIEVSPGAYAQRNDKEKHPRFSCRGAILEFFSPSPDAMAITAALELVVRRYKWTKCKCLGSKDFYTIVSKAAKMKNTMIEIINPPPPDKKEEDPAGDNSGRLDSLKMSSKSKGMKN